MRGIQKNIRQLVQRFGLYQSISVCTFILDLAAVYIAVTFLSAPSFAAVWGLFIVASLLAYTLNYQLTFKDTSRSYTEGLYYYIPFLVFRGLLAATLTWVITNHSTLPLLAARVTAGVVVGTISFIYDYIVTFRVLHRDFSE